MNARRLFLLSLVMIILFACNNKRAIDSESSGQSLNAEQIKDSLKAIVYKVFKNSETLNLEMALSPFLTTDDFLFISNGQKFSFNELKQIEAEYFSNLRQQSFNFTDQTYDVINNENAIVTLLGTLTATQKDGVVIKNNIAETILFKKINGIWKIIGGHESYFPDTIK